MAGAFYWWRFSPLQWAISGRFNLKINTLPIINFLNQDQHDQWRYLPLGFGDQMATLSYQTKALTVDGNYHSARRLWIDSRAVERLENSKFRRRNRTSTVSYRSRKYNLKYVFRMINFMILFYISVAPINAAWKWNHGLGETKYPTIVQNPSHRGCPVYQKKLMELFLY
jgi:hypothetical protein